MNSIWKPEAHRELRARIAKLNPEEPARWGRMNARQMVVHLSDAFRMASGEIAVRPRHLPIRYPPLKQLVIYALPFPKGAPTAPELLARQPGDWPVDVAELQALLDRFVASGPEKTVAAHPAFGRMTGRSWGVLVYRHMDHHLRQFGA
jgi:Protein of unknown function (DUF1569)